MNKLLIVLGVTAGLVVGCAERASHRPHRRVARPCEGGGDGWVNPAATPKLSEWGLNDSPPTGKSPDAAQAPRAQSSGGSASAEGQYRIAASQLGASSYTHKDGRVVSSGCAECHETVGKRCSGCNKIPPSAEYCSQCH